MKSSQHDDPMALESFLKVLKIAQLQFSVLLKHLWTVFSTFKASVFGFDWAKIARRKGC